MDRAFFLRKYPASENFTVIGGAAGGLHASPSGYVITEQRIAFRDGFPMAGGVGITGFGGGGGTLLVLTALSSSLAGRGFDGSSGAPFPP